MSPIYIPIQYISPSNLYPHPVYIPTQFISPSNLAPHPTPPPHPGAPEGAGGVQIARWALRYVAKNRYGSNSTQQMISPNTET